MFLRFVIAVLIAVITTGQARAMDLSEGRFHLTANIGSYHLNGAQEFNERNFGLGLGYVVPLSARVEAGVEIGQYRNSVENQSVYVMGTLDRHITGNDHLSLRLGAFGGFARYPGEENKFENTGIPTIGSWAMGLGAQAVLRVNDRYDLRLRAMPAGKVADVLFTFQIAAYF